MVAYAVALVLQPRDAGALVNVARLLQLLGRPAEAIAALEKVVEIVPQSVMARLTLARAYGAGECGGRGHADAGRLRGGAALGAGQRVEWRGIAGTTLDVEHSTKPYGSTWWFSELPGYLC